MLTGLLTTLTTMAPADFFRLRPAPPAPSKTPLTSLPLDVVLHIIDQLDPPALARTARTARPLHALCTPPLFAHVHLSRPAQLPALLAALERNPQLGLTVRTLSEDAATPFLADGSNAAMFQALLALTPNLRALRVHSPVPPLDLRAQTQLAELVLGDATRATLQTLASTSPAAPLTTLRVHCWPAALPLCVCPPPELAASLSAVLAAHPDLQTLEADAAVLADVPAAATAAVPALVAHGADGHVCAWCAPAGAVWEPPAGPKDGAAPGPRWSWSWARANVALCRWIMSVAGLSGGF